MIKLIDLLKVNNMKYSSTPTKKHKSKMNMKTELISGDMLVTETPHPDNSSKQTREELNWLITYNDGKIDKDMIKKGDDVVQPFTEYCKDNNLKFNKKYYKQIIKESTKTILSLKYYYNRPRPYQLGEYYGIEDFKIHKLDSAKTPSYPSGHTTQGHLMAELLGKEYPRHYDEFKKIADFISESRIMARAHFPSDIKFGKVVAKCIIDKIETKKL